MHARSYIDGPSNFGHWAKRLMEEGTKKEHLWTVISPVFLGPHSGLWLYKRYTITRIISRNSLGAPVLKPCASGSSGFISSRGMISPEKLLRDVFYTFLQLCVEVEKCQKWHWLVISEVSSTASTPSTASTTSISPFPRRNRLLKPANVTQPDLWNFTWVDFYICIMKSEFTAVRTSRQVVITFEDLIRFQTDTKTICLRVLLIGFELFCQIFFILQIWFSHSFLKSIISSMKNWSNCSFVLSIDLNGYI